MGAELSRAEGRTDRHTDSRQAGRQAGRHTDSQTDRQAGRKIWQWQGYVTRIQFVTRAFKILVE